MDPTALIQGKLRPGEKAIVVADAGIVQDWVKSPRLIALVEKQSEHALIIFSPQNIPVTCSNDVSFSNAIPIDHEFHCDPAFSKRKGPIPDFCWVQDYWPLCPEMDSSSAYDAVSVNDIAAIDLCDDAKGDGLDSDGAVRRRAIAMGEAPIAARESVVRYQMAQREGAFTDIHNFRIFVGTWNVNGNSPPASGLLEWLACDSEPPDLYAIAFQELDLSKEAFLFNDTPKEDEWTRAVITSLHPKARYRKKKQVRLVGMLLFVFVQERHDAYVTSLGGEVVGTGIMGKMGNKGGVSIRMEIHSTSLCFVNSHLAAHVEECERRNQDFHDICSRLSFSNFMPPKTIKHHDQIFWFGDLNYRIVGIESNAAKAKIDAGNWSELWSKDQLKQQQKDGKSFMGFNEAPLDFKPTYQYANNSDEWDNEKGRAPAWTDRILWKGDHIENTKYRSHPTLRSSDHRPVSALFNVGVKVIDPVRYRKIYEEVMKQLDKLENEFLPQVTVDKLEIIYDVVKFLEPQSKTLTIANTGQVPVQFEFIKKLNDSYFCKPWLSINPYADFLKPGEKRDIELRLKVDPTTVARLNSGQEQVYDILVLHLEGGKDLFITVQGDYQRTCFGLSLHTLVQLKVPVSEVPTGKLLELEADRESEISACNAGVPKEIWLMVDRLYNEGLDEDELFFAKQGLDVEIRAIRDALDTGTPAVLPGNVTSVAGALLLFLESLPEPVVPYRFHQQCLDSSSNYIACMRVAAAFPDHHRNLFFYICAFLKEALLHTSKNGLDPRALATLFGAIMLKEPVGSPGQGLPARTEQAMKARERQKANFVYHFLVNDFVDATGP
ncbi:unnamed protein product [Notodromas monacha]|uniref:phosphoinositide 5-phosphatase n=1 Tax=Notodromas monacha TaxID=399045 RepID=A0A7R9GCU4_9CRUS|nr:unnamed protein product [Notodromas monacha]CAG0918022.1 unnamed protein product [Notodromas monacha]